jgi:hypothetical protein
MVQGAQSLIGQAVGATTGSEHGRNIVVNENSAGYTTVGKVLTLILVGTIVLFVTDSMEIKLVSNKMEKQKYPLIVGTPSSNGNKTQTDGEIIASKTTNTESGTSETTSSHTTLEEATSSFPECFVPDWHLYTANKFLQDMTSHGKYVSSSHMPRYDHVSCFLMKARYNCEYPPGYDQPAAADYKFVRRHPKASRDCDFRDIVDFLGGPQGIAEMLLEQPNNSSRPLQVLIQGSSLLRQVFEALVCGFHDQITDLQLQVGGPLVSMAAIEERNGALMTIDEIGEIVGLEEAKRGGCHTGKSNISRLYRENVTVPPNIPDCNDNIGMVEFGGAIRFYYVFRPSFYERKTLTHIYRNIFGIRNEEMDLLVYNEDGKRTSLPLPKRTIRYSMHSPLKHMQIDDLGQYFGENNPFTSNPPGDHACLPGLPDDEANVLLFWLLAGSR